MNVDHAVDVSLLLISAIGAIGLLLWARTVLPLYAVAVSYATGALFVALTRASGSVNAWKFELAFPITVLVLALVARVRSTSGTVLALVALGLIGITNEYRSYFGFCLVVAALGLYDARRRVTSRAAGRLRVLTVMAVVAGAAYYLGTAALVQGYAGEVLQQRSVEQIARTGSLLLGGRPEWAVTARLMEQQPEGLGIGVVPLASDVRVGRAALEATGIPPDPIRDRYMFGGQFKLHSILADLWVSFGVAGLAFGLTAALMLVNALAYTLGRRRATALIGFLVLTALWNLAFGTIHTNLPDLALALGLALLQPEPTSSAGRAT